MHGGTRCQMTLLVTFSVDQFTLASFRIFLSISGKSKSCQLTTSPKLFVQGLDVGVVDFKYLLLCHDLFVQKKLIATSWPLLTTFSFKHYSFCNFLAQKLYSLSIYQLFIKCKLRGLKLLHINNFIPRPQEGLLIIMKRPKQAFDINLNLSVSRNISVASLGLDKKSNKKSAGKKTQKQKQSIQSVISSFKSKSSFRALPAPLRAATNELLSSLLLADQQMSTSHQQFSRENAQKLAKQNLTLRNRIQQVQAEIQQLKQEERLAMGKISGLSKYQAEKELFQAHKRVGTIKIKRGRR